MAKNNPFREKNAGLKSKKGIKNYAWLSSVLILLVTVVACVVTNNFHHAFAGLGILCIDLAAVAGIFYKNTKDRKNLGLLVLLIIVACLCLFKWFYGIELL